ncbi:hypothetical protein ACVWWI_004352 [Bradyrhizobium sp. USDA 3686]|uniref:TniB family NTP-binding protein n=1 Tax=Bradyrhizobium canariense TaxID=255045 RepID=UPI001957C9E5|nr:TniB family NTP-binding protein [Bradyrhizobium canariense]MBM7482337.1 hypothetical protein [Bradyrhizobium canariense]
MSEHFADPSAYLRDLWTDQDRKRNGRIEAVKGMYIETERDEILKGHLERLARNAALRVDRSMPNAADNRAPGKALVIVGPSGAGKTRLVQRTFRNNPYFPNYGVAEARSPLLSIQAPAPCTLLQIALRILEKLGYPIERDLRENKAWLRVRQQFRLHGILFLHIDDIQHVLHALSEDEVQKVRDTLKDIMLLDWPVQLILSGIPDLMPFVRKDRQLRRRCRFMYLSKLSAAEHAEFLDAAINEYAATAGLKVDIDDDAMLVGRLLHAGQYEMGISLEILGEAVEAALDRDGKTLKLVDFQNAYADRNLMPDDQNVFFANAWHTIDATLVRPGDAEEEKAEAQIASHKKNRRSKS